LLRATCVPGCSSSGGLALDDTAAGIIGRMIATLLALLVTTLPTPEVAATLTEVTAVAVAGVDGAEVLSTRDIEKIVELESQKQLAGCNASDCLAELAGSLGARFVVFGELGALEDQVVLTLNLYDAETARSVGRQLVRGAGATALSDAIPAAARSLLQPALASLTTRPVRVLVMNIKLTAGAAAPKAADNVLQPVGLTAIGIGAVVAVVGGVVGGLAVMSDRTAVNPETTQAEAKRAYDTRDAQGLAANVCFVAAAVVSAGGGTLWLIGME
jgi:hypothetical protein